MPELTRARCLCVTGVARARFDELCGRLFAAGALGLSEDWMPGAAPPPRQPWDPPGVDLEPDPLVVRAWFTGADEPEIDAWASRYGGVAWEDVEERDWEAEARAAFAPIEVAPGWVVAPPWDAPPGALIIEPGSGFGTGQHASTRTALRLLIRVGVPQPATALDVGCGSGVLALAAARMGLAAHGIDVEAGAIRDAARNAELNGLRATFSLEPLAEIRKTFGVVLANLHAELLVTLAPDLVRRTEHALLLAGILADREEAVRAAFAPALRCVDRETEEEWVASTWVRER